MLTADFFNHLNLLAQRRLTDANTELLALSPLRLGVFLLPHVATSDWPRPLRLSKVSRRRDGSAEAARYAAEGWCAHANRPGRYKVLNFRQ